MEHFEQIVQLKNQKLIINKVRDNFVKFFDDFQERGKLNLQKYDSQAESNITSLSDSTSEENESSVETDKTSQLTSSNAKAETENSETVEAEHDGKQSSRTNNKRLSFRVSVIHDKILKKMEPSAKSFSIITEIDSDTLAYLKNDQKEEEEEEEEKEKEKEERTEEEKTEEVKDEKEEQKEEKTEEEKKGTEKGKVLFSFKTFIWNIHSSFKRSLIPVDYDNLLEEQQLPQLFESQSGNSGKTIMNRKLISSIAFSMSLGNLWRFPLKCIEGGGASFLLVYFFLLLFVAMPIFLFETALGQFAGRGIVGAYTFSLAAKGVGATNLVICFVMSTCNGAILSWSLLYCVFSLFSQPWSECNRDWNAQPCYNIADMEDSLSNISYARDSKKLSSDQFFYGFILGNPQKISDGILNDTVIEQKEPKWYNLLCSFCAWSMVGLALLMDFEASNSAALLTIFAPLCVLYIILLISATLPRAITGLSYLILPDWNYLFKTRTWLVALDQVLYTLTMSGGFRTAQTTNNMYTFHADFYKDLIMIVVGQSFISIISAVICFQLLGYHMLNTSLASVPSDPALIFRLMSSASIEFGPIFGNILCFLLFSALFFVGLHTQSGINKCVISHFVYEFSGLFKKSILAKALLVMILCLGGYCLGIPYLIPGGYFLFILVDDNVLAKGIVICSFCKTILVIYGYGWRKLCEDIYMMINYRVGIFWMISWRFICPLIMCSLYIIGEIAKLPFQFEVELNQLGLRSENEISWIKYVVIILTILASYQVLILPIILFIKRLIYKRNVSCIDNFIWLFKERPLWGPYRKTNWLISKRYRAKLGQLNDKNV